MTAREILLEHRGNLVNHGEIEAMIEFAKLHVARALKKASEEGKVHQHSRDYTIGRKSKIIRQKTEVYEVDRDSILNAYDLDLIK